MDMPRPMGSGKLSANSKAKENTPEASQKMKRDSRVSEHLDTNSAIVTASLSGHRIEIPEKRRPPVRSNNLRTYGWIPFPVTSMRVPVNFGDIEGGVHSSPSPSSVLEYSDRSFRKGKEQARFRASEGRVMDGMRARDSRMGDNPCSWVREI